MHRCLAALSLLLVQNFAAAQWSDDFSDGDFLNDPTWSGTTALWRVVAFEGYPMLASNGGARADTLYLATPSDAAYGHWQFRFAYKDVNLSNFNGARVFLVADTDSLRGEVHGYYLQFGTNNARDVRLVRMDGEPLQRRREIGRSAGPMLESTSDLFEVEVSRDDDDLWQVWINGSLALSATDGTYRTSSHFGFWVKHTAATGQGYFFGDVDVVPGEAPAPDPLWIEAVETVAARLLDVRFSRPVWALDACRADTYRIDGTPSVDSVDCPDNDATIEVRLRLLRSLTQGRRLLSIDRLRDAAGETHEALAYDFEVQPDDVRPFVPIAIHHTLRAADRISIDMSRPIHPERLSGIEFELSPHLPVRAIEPGDAPHRIAARLALPPGPGSYTIHLRNVYSENEEHYSGSANFTVGRPPEPRDLVINEIHFAPSDQQLEFIELYNRSDHEIDLTELDYADDRLDFTPVSTAAQPVSPGSYAVLIRDSVAFRASFPGVDFVQPPVWHILNNPGDAVHIRAGEVVIDSVTFTAAWGAGAASLERIDPDAPSIRQNFGPSEAEQGATPGQRNSIFSNERKPITIVAAFEASTGVVDAVFSGPIRIDQDRPPVVTVDGFPAQSVTLRDASTMAIHHVLDRPKSLSMSGLTSALGDAVATTTAEIASRPRRGELVISEIMFDPLSDPNDGLPDQPEYLEIANVSGRLIALGRIALADAFDENGMSRYITHTDPYAIVSDGSFAVFSAEPDDHPSGESKLGKAFAGSFKESRLLRVRRSTLGLPLRGRLVRLVAMQDGLEEVELESLHYDPSWHHGAVRDARGRSLERIDLLGLAGDPANWSTSVAPAGGTPGAVNSVAIGESGIPATTGLTIEPRVFSPDNEGVTELAHIRFRLTAASSVVRARVFDSRGRVVRDLETSALTGPEGSITWDGFDNQRNRLPIGIYIVLLDSTDVETGSTEAFRDVVVLARPLR